MGMPCPINRPVRQESSRIFYIGRFVLLVILLSLVAGCNREQIVSDVNQIQANEVIAKLGASGIEAFVVPESGGRGKFSVEVDSDNRIAATTILVEEGLPKPLRQSVEDILAPGGLMPNSREIDAARLDRAIALQIQELIESLPAVSQCKAVLRVNYLGDSEKPAASLVITTAAGGGTGGGPGLKEQALPLIKRLLPGLSADDLTIEVVTEPVQAQSQPPTGTEQGMNQPTDEFSYFLLWQIPRGSYSGLAITVIVSIVLMGIVGVVVGYWLGFSSQSSRPIPSPIVSELEGGFVRSGALKVKKRPIDPGR